MIRCNAGFTRPVLAWCPMGRLLTQETGENDQLLLRGTLRVGCALSRPCKAFDL